MSVFVLLENMCGFELMASLRANQCEGPGDGAERCRWQIQRGGGREKQGEPRSATSERGDYVFLGSRGYVRSTSATPTIKTKSGNTRCSLAFFFVLYGFFMLRKITDPAQMADHPITFSAANRRQKRRRRIYASTTKKSKLK